MCPIEWAKFWRETSSSGSVIISSGYNWEISISMFGKPGGVGFLGVGAASSAGCLVDSRKKSSVSTGTHSVSFSTCCIRLGIQNGVVPVVAVVLLGVVFDVLGESSCDLVLGVWCLRFDDSPLNWQIGTELYLLGLWICRSSYEVFSWCLSERGKWHAMRRPRNHFWSGAEHSSKRSSELL